MIEQIDWQETQPTREASVSEGLNVLKSLRHHLRPQSQGYYTISHQEERGVRDEALDDLPLKGRERAIVNQMNIGTVSEATLGKLPRDGVERILVFPSA